MKQKLIFLLFILCAFRAISQDSLSKNHFSILLVDGVSFTRPQIVQGEGRFRRAAGISHGLNFQYTHNFSDHFALSGIAGFGIVPFTYRITEKDSLPGTSMDNYFERSDYKMFTNLALQGAYRSRISSRYAYRVHAGAGVRHFETSYISIGSGNQTGPDYELDMQFLGGWKPYVTFGGGWIRQIRNEDEVSLSVAYDQSFSDIYRGSYYLNGGSKGTFSNTGSNFNLSIGYTFTGNGRRQRMAKLMESGTDSKAVKKLYRKEIRYIDPKSTFIALYGGMGFGTNRLSDQGGHLKHGTFATFVPRLTVEKGIAKNYFAEAGFHYATYWSTMRTPVSMFGSVAFDAYQLSIGAGKRIITKNNYNIINLHAGLSFGMTNLQKGLSATSYIAYTYSDSTSNGIQQHAFSSYSEDYVSRTFLTSAYIGASKDFRLVRNFYLSLSYRFNQGFYSVYEQRIDYTFDGNATKARISLNGSSHIYQLGFKLKVGPRPEKVLSKE